MVVSLVMRWSDFSSPGSSSVMSYCGYTGVRNAKPSYDHRAHTRESGLVLRIGGQLRMKSAFSSMILHGQLTSRRGFCLVHEHHSFPHLCSTNPLKRHRDTLTCLSTRDFGPNTESMLLSIRKAVLSANLFLCMLLMTVDR